MQQTSNIQVIVADLEFLIPVPAEIVEHIRLARSKQEAAEEFEPVAMLIVAGLTHQLEIEKEPPTGYQMFKAVTCARELRIDVPIAALVSKRSMSQFIYECEKRKRSAKNGECVEQNGESGPTLRFALADSGSNGNVMQTVRKIFSNWKFRNHFWRK